MRTLWLQVFNTLLNTIFVLLMSAGCNQNESAIEFLKANNIVVNADSLGIYSSQGDLATVKRLLDASVDVNAKNSLGSVALIEASWAGNKDMVSYLLSAKADVNLVSSGRLTALGAAVGQNHEEVAILLLDHNANPNTLDPAGSTPLIEAAWQGNLNLVKNLIAKGANPNFKRPDNGFSALKAAGNKQDILQLLKAAGATE